MSSHCESPVDHSGGGLPRHVDLAAILVNRHDGTLLFLSDVSRSRRRWPYDVS